ncbi:MAG TPA: GNAT family N-acetyltransferase [Flavisolibacter sp.]|nr:GNAT family N-acetyltransferase [Flavisolibacter sp.]
MEKLLNNPVYKALISGNQKLALGTATVKYFPEDVSPFAGFEHDYEKGFGELYDLFPSGRKILYASPLHIYQHKGWLLLHKVPGLQFVFDTGYKISRPSFTPLPLGEEHIGQMMQLAALTKPGPFGTRTIEFGNYYGFFENAQLIAMTGQRLHVQNFAEVSAVCTHPDHLGKGYASALVQHQVQLIVDAGETPFLHVREDNLRAIEVYRRLGFKVSGTMNFYFLQREE